MNLQLFSMGIVEHHIRIMIFGVRASMACLQNDYCCVEYVMFVIALGCFVKLHALSTRQSRGWSLGGGRFDCVFF